MSLIQRTHLWHKTNKYTIKYEIAIDFSLACVGLNKFCLFWNSTAISANFKSLGILEIGKRGLHSGTTRTIRSRHSKCSSSYNHFIIFFWKVLSRYRWMRCQSCPSLFDLIVYLFVCLFLFISYGNHSVILINYLYSNLLQKSVWDWHVNDCNCWICQVFYKSMAFTIR